MWLAGQGRAVRGFGGDWRERLPPAPPGRPGAQVEPPPFAPRAPGGPPIRRQIPRCCQHLPVPLGEWWRLQPRTCARLIVSRWRWRRIRAGWPPLRPREAARSGLALIRRRRQRSPLGGEHRGSRAGRSPAQPASPPLGGAATGAWPPHGRAGGAAPPDQRGFAAPGAWGAAQPAQGRAARWRGGDPGAAWGGPMRGRSRPPAAEGMRPA